MDDFIRLLERQRDAAEERRLGLNDRLNELEADGLLVRRQLRGAAEEATQISNALLYLRRLVDDGR